MNGIKVKAVAAGPKPSRKPATAPPLRKAKAKSVGKPRLYKNGAPIGDTPPDTVPPPALNGEPILPLVAIGSVRFEHLCRDILRLKFAQIESVALKRTSGAPQYGVDVEGRDLDHEPEVVVQAKCYREVKAKYLRPWVREFTDHLGNHWSGKKIRHFVLAVSHEANDDEINDEWRGIVAELKALNIQGHLWNSYDITDTLRRDAGLVARYFHEFWVSAIAAAGSDKLPAVQSTGGDSSGLHGSPVRVAEMANAQALAALVPLLGASASARLDAALADLRAGREKLLTNFLAETIDNPVAWDALPPELQARLLRSKAIARLRADDTVEARSLIDQADALAPPPDAVTRAVIAAADGTIQDGLLLLSSPATVREREVKAGWLLEVGAHNEALSVLDGVSGEEVTAEVLRLRAVAQFSLGRRDQALRMAISACAKAPRDAMPRLTLGSIRVMSALADGSETQFGTAPNPINPRLVKDTKDARKHLRDAVADFEHLIGVVDPPLQADVEVWRLAALLLHPERSAEARTAGRQILRRTEPAPVAVAWGIQYGLRMQVGRIRKRFGDMIRSGRATPTHLVVLAMFASKWRGATAGLHILDQLAHHFPQAREFIEGWRANFGDPQAKGSTLPRLIHQSMRDKNNAPLVAFLLSGDASADDLLAGASFLTDRRAWNELDELRTCLTRIGTQAAFRLAATAAIECGKPKDAIEIIGASAHAFDEGRLPRNLVHVRIRASERLGWHRPVIEDLTKLISENDDVDLRRRLTIAFLRIGDLKRANDEFERMLDGRTPDRSDLLGFADALQAYAPETARRAVSLVGDEQSNLTPEMVSTLLGLAGPLGLSELQSRLIPLIVADANRPGSTVKTLSIKEMLELVREQAAEARARIEGWLRGESPAAVAMAHDAACFARLFLASPSQRCSQDGTEFPMLLRSAVKDQPLKLEIQDRPLLRLDLSALLLAHRLDLLDAISKGFEIQIPASLPEALVKLEQSFTKEDAAFIETCRVALGADGTSASGPPIPFERRVTRNIAVPSSNHLFVVDSASANALALHDEEESALIRPGLLRALVKHGFEEGYLADDDVEAAIAVDTDADAKLDPFPVRLLLNTSTLFKLMRAGLLTPLASAYEIEITRIEAECARESLVWMESNASIRAKLTGLREAIAERLLEGVWVSIPSVSPTAVDEQEAGLPPHLRCLIETLRDMSPGSLAWIEDRVVSRGLGGRQPDIVAILDALLSAGIIEQAKVRRSLRCLRDIGCSFMPVDRSMVLTDLQAATTDEGEIVETSELIAWRSWFALDVSRLQFIDTTLLRDKDGAVSGEVRRALALGNLTRGLLGDIWRDETADAKLKIARSNWIWKSLRAETYPFATKDPEAIRQHTALMISHVLDLPFMAWSADERLPLEGQQGFVDWFLDQVLEPAARADEQLADLVAAFTANMFNSWMRLDSLKIISEDERPQIQRELRRMVARFLDLLPDEWTDRVVAKCGLSEELSRVTRTVLALEGDSVVPVTELERAYGQGLEQAVRGEGATLTIATVRGDELTLEIAPCDGAEPSACVIMADRRLALDAMTVAMLHPDPETRLSGLLEIPYLVDPAGSIGPENWREVAQTRDVQERFFMARSVMEGDLYRHLTRLHSGFKAGQQISLDEFSLPEPEVIARYLDLTVADIDSPQAVADGCIALAKRIGPADAAARFAGWPQDLPQDAIDLLGSDSAAFESGEKAWASTPMRILMRLRLLNGREELAAVAATFCDHLIDALSSEVAKLFSAFVRFASRQAGVAPNWTDLAPTTRISLIWVWASAMTDVFASANGVGNLAAFLSHWTMGDLQNQIADERLPQWERVMGPNLSTQRLQAVMVSRCLEISTPNAEFTGRLQFASRSEERDDWEPSQHLLLPPPDAPDELWAAKDSIRAMASAGWVAVDAWYSHRDMDTLVRHMLETMGYEAEPFILPATLAQVDVDRVSREVLEEMRDAIERKNGEHHAEPHWIAAAMIMNASAAVWGKLDDVEGFRIRLKAQAQRCARQWPRARPRASQPMQRSVAMSLAESAFRHGRSLPRPVRDQMMVFAGNVEVAAAAWPNFNTVFIDALELISRRSSIDVASTIWPSLMRLREKIS